MEVNKVDMQIEVDRILKRGNDNEVVEFFDGGTFEVTKEVLYKIYIAGFKCYSQFHGKVKAWAIFLCGYCHLL